MSLLLAVDIGNTNIGIGAFAGDELRHHWRIETRREATGDTYGAVVLGALAASGVRPEELCGVVICSVVPRLTEEFARLARRYLKHEADVLHIEDLDIRTPYQPPSSIGMDRIANALAVRERHGLPAVVVDFGTATTVDAVAEDGTYLGGAIAPGIETAVEALYARAALLHRADLHLPRSALGTTTADSLRSGIIYGFAGQVDGIVRRILAELSGEPCVVATGGQAKLIAPVSETIQKVDEHLTLHGVRIAHELKKRRAG